MLVRPIIPPIVAPLPGVLGTGLPWESGGGGAAVSAPTISIAGTVAHGQTLTATVSGTPAPTLQWYAGAVAISGQTGSTYVVDRANGGFYTGITCRAANAVSTVESNTLLYDYLTSLGTIAIAHDFAEDVTVVSGGVDSIADQGPNGNTLTAASASVRPTYTASDSGFNNQPTGTGDGTDDVIRIASATLGGTFGPGALICVLKLVTNTNGRAVQSLNSTGAYHVQNTTGRIAIMFTAVSVIAGENFTTDARFICSVADGTNARRYVAGVESGTASAFSGTIATGVPYGLFATSGSTFPSNVAIATAIVCRTLPTTAQISDFNTYSVERWGTS